MFSVLIVISFTLFQSRSIIAGPKIEIFTPESGSTASDSLVEIRGKTQNISEIKLNNRSIFIDEEGNFEEKLLLSYGYNIITIEGRDRFNREEKKTIELVLK